jgi:hypothetical protein
MSDVGSGRTERRKRLRQGHSPAAHRIPFDRHDTIDNYKGALSTLCAMSWWLVRHENRRGTRSMPTSRNTTTTIAMS